MVVTVGRTEKVLTMLIADIEAGELQPGAALRECALAARYGVSRTPVREALMHLAATGMVVRVPNKGCRVKPREEGSPATRVSERSG